MWFKVTLGAAGILAMTAVSSNAQTAVVVPCDELLSAFTQHLEANNILSTDERAESARAEISQVCGTGDFEAAEAEATQSVSELGLPDMDPSVLERARSALGTKGGDTGALESGGQGGIAGGNTGSAGSNAGGTDSESSGSSTTQ